MFYSLTGEIIDKDETQAVIACQGGVAYELLISRRTAEALPAPGGQATLYTRLIVRENEQYLVGFTMLEDRRLFDTLLDVSGIGPKQGLKILSELSAHVLRDAIVSGNERELSRVKGVGPKMASRIILELQEKMRKIPAGEVPEAPHSDSKKKLELLMAMRVLGYTDNESRRVIDSVFTQDPSLISRSVEDLIKVVLARIGRS